MGLGHLSARVGDELYAVHLASVEAVHIEADYRCWQTNKEKRDTVTIWFG